MGELGLGCLRNPRKEARSSAGWRGWEGCPPGALVPLQRLPRTVCGRRLCRAALQAELGLPLLPSCPSAVTPDSWLLYCPSFSPKPPRSGFGSC